MSRETVEWQTELMHKYGVDGLIYYHYYFKGRMLLEKPAENLLKWKNIDQGFFFCWANHDWARTWEGTTKLLMKQEYGTQEDWEAHFQYLLPFFKDSRYEKKDKMPLFMVFNPDFPEMKEYFEYLDGRCRDEGFDGIYLIESYNVGRMGNNAEIMEFADKRPAVCRSVFVREPNVSLRFYTGNVRAVYTKIRNILLKKLNYPVVTRFDGNVLYRKLLKEVKREDLIHGLFFSWDNTPRHKKRGYVITPPSKEMFDKVAEYYQDQEYVFINAWNEWAEGMIMEPTVENGFRFLEWTKEL